MASPARPFFRKQTRSRYCSIAGKQISLGKDTSEAHQRFHELMANRERISEDATTLYPLSQSYPDWFLAHRSEGDVSAATPLSQALHWGGGKRIKPTQLKLQHIFTFGTRVLIGSHASSRRRSDHHSETVAQGLP